MTERSTPEARSPATPRAEGEDATRAEIERLRRELAEREQELRLLNQELHESNSGILALYAELDEKAIALQHTAEVKSRFLASVSHEFKTPINSIVGLTKLLLARSDGPLTPEQEKQLGFIDQSAATLSMMVHDVLDLSKAEVGKLALRAAPFDAEDIFAALRGMMRPLVTRESVELVFDDPPSIAFDTDDGKVSQILRNFISNAIKFTTTGEVRVSARDNGDGTATFAVADTGIGIAPADQERIFEEFTQIENPLQKNAKGTGLGLSLSKNLATLLGGTIAVESEPGKGSTFSLTIPTVHPESVELAAMQDRNQTLDPARRPVLVVEDDRQTLFLYEKYLAGSGFQVLPARTVDEAREVLARVRPAAVVLDVMLEGESSWAFLNELKTSPATADIPALVVTVTNREQKARALGADEFCVKPIDKDWLFRKLDALATVGPMERILVIDDDPAARYLVRKLLKGSAYSVSEASDGPEGIAKARKDRPHLIILDFVMPQMSAFEVLDELKSDPKTRYIPVIVNTSKDLSPEEQRRLATDTAAVMSKQTLSREVAIARIREALSKALPAGR
jgi:signal transduction histidine kinase/CheY-like chemotaxis protein